MKKTRIVTHKTSRIIAWAVLRDYLYYLSDTKRIIFNNFLAGLFRGFGYAVGFTVLGAFVLSLLTLLASEDMPVIGEIIKRISEQLH